MKFYTRPHFGQASSSPQLAGYRLECSRGPGTRQSNKERVCPLGQKALDACSSTPSNTSSIARENRKGHNRFSSHGGTGESEHPENHPQVGYSRRHQETSQPACLQAQCGNTHAGERRRLANDSAVARPRQHHNDGNLYSRQYSSIELGPRQHTSKG